MLQYAIEYRICYWQGVWNDSKNVPGNLACILLYGDLTISSENVYCPCEIFKNGIIEKREGPAYISEELRYTCELELDKIES